MTNLLHFKSEWKTQYVIWVYFTGLMFCCVNLTSICGQNNVMILKRILLKDFQNVEKKIPEISSES